VHGDVKPGNILVPVDGSPVRLTDFGVARRLTDPGQGRATHATPEYVAHEVIGGAPPRPSTDVYALGIVLYELLCGRTPYRGGAASEVLYRHISCMPVPPAGFPEALWPLVVACLAANPDDRPAAVTLAQQLRTVQSSLAALAPLPATGPETVTWRPREDTLVVPAPIPYETTVPARGTRRRALLAGVVGAAALLVLLAGLGAVLMLRGGGSGGPAPHPVAVVTQQPSPAASTPVPSSPAARVSSPAASSPAPKPSTPPATSDPTGGTDTGTGTDNTPDNQPPTVPLLPGMGSQLPTFPGN
jgi:serine/threonine protein kinase